MNVFVTFLIAVILTVSADVINPEGVHLSWTENQGEIRITWTTKLPSKSYATFRPLLCDNAVNPSVWNQSRSNDTKFIYGSPEKYNHQFIHTATISNLNPNCFYEYYVGCNWVVSEKFVFSGRTPVRSSTVNDGQSFKALIFGNWGHGTSGQYTSYLMSRESQIRDFDAVFHLGNIAYSLDSNNGQTGDDFFNMIQPITSSYPYMTIPGSQEDAANYTQYLMRFLMPKNNDNKGTGFFYSLNIGPVHFALINTELYFNESSASLALEQTNWLKNDLISANQQRTARPWIVILTHRPIYCASRMSATRNKICGNEASVLKETFEEIFYENSVDLVISAHLNGYERSAAVYKNEVLKGENSTTNEYIDPAAPVYIVSGAAGNSEGLDPIYPSASIPETIEFIGSTYGYGRIYAINATDLYWEQYNAANLTQIDYLWISKSHARY